MLLFSFIASHDHRDGSPVRIQHGSKATVAWATIEVVFDARPRSAVAPLARSVSRVDQRDHAAADAGGHGRRRTSIASFARFPMCNRWQLRRKPTCCGCGKGLAIIAVLDNCTRRPRKLSPNTAADFPTRLDGVATTARHRPLHGGRDRIDRVRSPGADPGSEYDSAVKPARRLPWQSAFAGRPAAAVAGRRRDIAAKTCGRIQSGADGSWVRWFARPANRNATLALLSAVCAAFAAGLQHEIPLAKPRQVYTDLREAAVIVRKNGSVLVRQCAADERWAGLWDFPRFAVEADGPLFARKEIAAKVASQTGIECAPGGLLKTMKHGVTRYRITLDCYQATYVSGRVRATKSAAVRWLPVGELPCSRLVQPGGRLPI